MAMPTVLGPQMPSARHRSMAETMRSDKLLLLACAARSTSRRISASIVKFIFAFGTCGLRTCETLRARPVDFKEAGWRKRAAGAEGRDDGFFTTYRDHTFGRLGAGRAFQAKLISA